jgi:hypothetical protein
MGLIKNLFGRKKDYSEPSMSLEQATEIVWAYGGVLENSTPAPGSVADASRLPYSKPKIKQALIVMLRSSENPRIKEYLKSAYLSLADWQEGVGQANNGCDLSNADHKSDPKKRKKQSLSQAKNFEKWYTKAKAEGLQLESELQNLGL